MQPDIERRRCLIKVELHDAKKRQLVLPFQQNVGVEIASNFKTGPENENPDDALGDVNVSDARYFLCHSSFFLCILWKGDDLLC